MALRGKVPSAVQKRLKMMIFGVPGCGKTTCALQFPKPYLIDTEKGAENDQYIRLLEAQGGAIFQSSNFDEVYNEIKALAREKHEYKTLIIDSITTIYSNLLESCAEKVGEKMGRHYGEANKRMQSLINFIMQLDMNVIVTAHSKNEYGENLAVLDKTFDGWKKLDYIFDLVFEIKYAEPSRLGVVRKSRVEGFKVGEKFAFSYDEVKNRYGGDLLEKECENIPLASQEQLKQLFQLIEIKQVPEPKLEAWKAQAGVEHMDQLNEIQIQKIIDYLKVK